MRMENVPQTYSPFYGPVEIPCEIHPALRRSKSHPTTNTAIRGWRGSFLAAIFGSHPIVHQNHRVFFSWSGLGEVTEKKKTLKSRIRYFPWCRPGCLKGSGIPNKWGSFFHPLYDPNNQVFFIVQVEKLFWRFSGPFLDTEKKHPAISDPNENQNFKLYLSYHVYVIPWCLT